ncbi:substrate-binding domain-containing protein [Desulfotalea psychrophila]|nr:substrate-binding domain-containing protein [Desulfotalea psychrophila]
MLKKGIIIAAALLTVAPILSVQAASGRDYITVVGSSTVYPFATTVAEQFGKTSKFRTPKIESTGSGGGMKLFCAGVGAETPDITNASRRIKFSEYEKCQANGVKEIIEVKIGYDGIVVANSKKADQMTLTTKDLFLALAKDVPNPKGGEKLVANPYKTWKDVNASLPDTKIEVLGPPPTSGTRDAFVELAMEGGCKQIGWIKALKKKDKSHYKAVCHTIREDGAYIEAGENDNLIVQKLQANPKALGIFGFSFLDQNGDKMQGSLINGQDPTFDNIAAGKGGTIKRIIAHLNPRRYNVVALAKPNETELTQWYFQRYTAHLPTAGVFTIFDRSWYNRAMVEPVMNFCSDEQNKRFLKDVPMLEELLVKDGITLFKFYFSVSKDVQKERFDARKTDPLKQYKLSPVDNLAQKYWNEYAIRKFQMLSETNRTIAPWTIIRSDNKKLARINCIKYILSNMDYEDKLPVEELIPDPEIVVSGIDELHHMELNLMSPHKLHG